MMSEFDIRHKKHFANMCGVTYNQFRNWEKKYRVPAYRITKLKLAIITRAKQDFDNIVDKVLKF